VRGQASAEFVALLPLVVLVLAIVGQAVLAGYAVWQARVAARAAARAGAIGADARQAALDHLPAMLEHGARINDQGAGDVRVTLRVPALIHPLAVGDVSASAHFEDQDR
jgi:uncharacterized protein (UPF0333 family)